jgi:hypothetical protein
MQGVAILLFSKRSYLSRIKELYLAKIKAGTGGHASNKGSVALRFKIDETTFALINCHLAAGSC